MNDEELKKGLKKAFAAVESKPPSFNEAMAAAASRQARSALRWKAVAGVAAITVLAVAVSLLQERPAEFVDEYLIADALMNSTSWTAPSDSLMPEHQFDIYREVPFPDPSTISEEGSLL